MILCMFYVSLTICWLMNYCFSQILVVEQVQNKHLQLTDEGQSVVANGSHEAVVFNAVPGEGILQAKLMVSLYG